MAITTTKPPKPTTTTTTTSTATKLVCFSFAAYAKTLIDHLTSLNIPILPGLTDLEFASIESTFHFTFPPDLRSILQEGLPIGPHFPNWRSSSLQQLQILLNLPSLNLSKNVSQNNFWVDSWGRKSEDSNKALDIAKQLLDKAPVLVPIYRNCYIPSTPSAAGNPVFYVNDEEVRVLSFDVNRFFQEIDFLQVGVEGFRPSGLARNERVRINVPAWAATNARKIEFWTEVAERGRRAAARAETRGWWTKSRGGDFDFLEDALWRLRDGGWREEEVRDMMMMDGCDQRGGGCGASEFDKEEMFWHVRIWSMVLLRAGWSREDVVYSLDLGEFGGDDDHDQVAGGKSFCDFQLPNCHFKEDDDDDDNQNRCSLEQLMKLQSPEA